MTGPVPHRALCFAEAADGWASKRSSEARSLWAKSGDESGFLPLPQHLVDTACVAAAVYDSWLAEPVKESLAIRLGVGEEGLRSLILWLAGTHDIGKACKTFQTQVEVQTEFSYLVTNLDDAGIPRTRDHRELEHKMPHGVVSAAIIQCWLESRGLPGPVALHLSEVAGAHHGIASALGDYKAVKTILNGYEDQWSSIHQELLDAMAELTAVLPALEALRFRPAPSAGSLQVLTGIVVLSDWIASNPEAFPMRVEGSQRQRLINGMEATDLTAPWTPTAQVESIEAFFRNSFGWPEEFGPRAIQRSMVEAADSIGEPTLLILEAGTGLGKTEAALAAAQVIGRKTEAQGIYFAAPTMATANGLLERTMQWAARTAEAQSVASMYLAHSKNQLSQLYQQLRIRGIEPDRPGGAGTVVASSWMTGRRRGMLSNIVVGTVDQVLMMALQQRYSMLRHVALAGKIVIFDEVHSFDTYTSEYLETTLEWLAYYGVSVIMMSATLPKGRRDALIEAYTGAAPSESSDAYPLITVANESSASYIEPLPSPTDLVASVRTLDDDLTTLTRTLTDLLTEGGCALVICNTIARAQDTFLAVTEMFPGEAELHHAGFMAWERAQREDALQDKLGPTSHRGAGRPERLVVVATQVAEQSLDIDADVLITDIAPMDLLIQRVGRIHRHQRPDSDRPTKLRDPQVYVRGVLERGLVPEFDSGAEAIYGRYLLLSTLHHLPSTFRRPDDVAELVQAVYEEEKDAPAGWEDTWGNALREEKERAESARRRSSTFRIPSPFQMQPLANLFAECAGASIALADEERGAAQVRDAEPTVEVIPIICSENGYKPLGEEYELAETGELTYAQAFRLASSTVRLPARMTRSNRDFEEVVSTLEQSTPAHWQQHFLLKGQLALPLEADATLDLGPARVRYSSELGLESRFEKTDHVSPP